ncbi:hypothetical protein CDAR_434331 [Caerostris darwini]|uniref:Uncharacterized protein n=1 Tax=Caerostris darwini TaxID=1538125 RepID=A0AAV4UA63_9ARAC|nr:hypothetical protein CDAR_434331 [Caerostris darwini]
MYERNQVLLLHAKNVFHNLQTMLYFNTFSLFNNLFLIKIWEKIELGFVLQISSSLCEIQRCIIRVPIFNMEPSVSLHAFNLESRRWKVREESGKDERGGGEINSCRRTHEAFQLL